MDLCLLLYLLMNYQMAEYKFNNKTDTFEWFDEQEYLCSKQITHFCIPDPIEIEDD